MCPTGIYLRGGRIEATGPVASVIEQYQAAKNLQQLTAEEDKPAVVTVDVEVKTAECLVITVGFRSPFPFVPIVGVVVSTRDGQPLFGTNRLTHRDDSPQEQLRGGAASVVLRDIRLLTGTYSITVWLTDQYGTVHQHLQNIRLFDYISEFVLPNSYSSDTVGPIRVDAGWRVYPDDRTASLPASAVAIV